MRFAVVLVAACSGGGGTIRVDAGCEPAVLHLNRAGGTFRHAAFDDASANVSSLVEIPESVLPPWPHDSSEWASLAGCIRTALAPLPVTVTEEDPGDVPHVELVFTTAYWAGPLGTTVVHTASCGGSNDVGFVFGSALPTYARGCHVALRAYAQMIAGLDLADDCEDVLNNDLDCAPDRRFKDAEATCVDEANVPMDCRCGGATQNSYQAMLAATRCR